MQGTVAIGVLPVGGSRTEHRSGLGAVADEALMLRYGGGDNDAFEILYRRHRAGLHRFVRRLVGASADEVFQEVWLAVIKARKRYRPDARFVTWLYTIAHHRAVDRLRRNGQWPDEALDDEADEAPGPFEAAFGGELADALQAAVQALPAPQREAFLLQAEAGLSLEEIAAASAVSRETVKSRLRYATKRLRAALESYR
jgi:RNA polymerase sigma-70 factor (ECF subfamily)